MSPWPPQGEREGKGTRVVTLPRPGHADLAGALKYGHADVRDTLERASARQTAMTVAAGAVSKALLREIRIEVSGSVVESGDVDAARAERDTVGGIVEVRAGRPAWARTRRGKSAWTGGSRGRSWGPRP
jgi:chorismate synthase